jgi:hypothetical protein
VVLEEGVGGENSIDASCEPSAESLGVRSRTLVSAQA